ncbi:OmpA family protein [Larkinella harenae]
MTKRWFLILWFLITGFNLDAQAQKIVQRDTDPPQVNNHHGGLVTKVEYTQHKMIVHFRAENNEHATIYGPGHPNSWRLYDEQNKKEYALLYIRNIRVDGNLIVPMLDKPQGEEFTQARLLTCEAHFERPGKDTRKVNLIEEGVQQYKSRTPNGINAQWPYNVYDLRVLVYKDDMRNASPPATKAAVKPKPAAPAPKSTVKPKPATPTKKPAPQTVPKDSAIAQIPPKTLPKPTAPAPKVENFGSNVEAGRTYRLNNLLFNQSAYEIQPNSYPELDSLVALMQRNPTMEIELAGHTDNVGDAKLNIALSQNRVNAVKSYLVNKKIPANRIQTKAYGGSKPIASNAQEQTRRLNRRVEVTILKQ